MGRLLDHPVLPGVAPIAVFPSGDSSGFSDRIRINAAITQAASGGGGLVRLAAGDWYVNASITPQSGVMLAGAGAGTRIRRTTNGQIVYGQAIAFDGFALDSITFLGPVTERLDVPQRARATSGPGASSAVFLAGDLDPDGAGNAALSNFTMRNCRVDDCTSLPIYIRGVRGTVRVVDCDFRNNMDVGFIFCEEVIFANNHVERSADNGVSISRGCSKVTCTGNTFDTCCYNGIWLSGFAGTPGAQNFAVTGNVIRNVGHNGIDLDEAPKHGTISGNHIDCGYYRGPVDSPVNNEGAGILIGGYPGNNRAAPTNLAEGLLVTGNSIRRAARAGVYLAGGKAVVVSNNLISDVGTQFLADGVTAIAASDLTQNVGVLLDQPTTSSHLVVKDNVVLDTRATSWCNWAVVPGVEQVDTHLYERNSYIGLRNG